MPSELTTLRTHNAKVRADQIEAEIRRECGLIDTDDTLDTRGLGTIRQQMRSRDIAIRRLAVRLGATPTPTGEEADDG